MENASKALLIAGGILIGIITISIFYFSFGNVSSLVGETQENTQQKELLAFNSSFEAYNKKAMYGADIISVLNKAIDNNLKNGVEQDKEKNFISNDTNSLEVEIQFLYDEQTGEKKVFSMEKVYYRGIQEFIQNFTQF